MFGKGPTPGATPKADALKFLPAGTKCKRISGLGLNGCAVVLPDGKQVATAGNAGDAWRKAESWAIRKRIKARY